MVNLGDLASWPKNSQGGSEAVRFLARIPRVDLLLTVSLPPCEMKALSLSRCRAVGTNVLASLRLGGCLFCCKNTRAATTDRWTMPPCIILSHPQPHFFPSPLAGEGGRRPDEGLRAIARVTLSDATALRCISSLPRASARPHHPHRNCCSIRDCRPSPTKGRGKIHGLHQHPLRPPRNRALSFARV